MADKSRTLMRRKDRKEKESAEMAKEVKNEGERALDHGEPPLPEVAVSNGAVADGENGDFEVEPMEVPPFEIIVG